ncbi:hypothetical protein GCM10010435_70730 [Winogradskya consettensis]|uniref:Uncharacterized protein n=1 Tax=Winogradskya consettensis TaxID=113560 RepID=A0A919VQZ0_9ACTN|nr:hypothetical protein [Actinoplanes consettensis]GIM75444.1 hypothetical protein Aco04nite_45380 [Actinoplanes consettensis]
MRRRIALIAALATAAFAVTGTAAPTLLTAHQRHPTVTDAPAPPPSGEDVWIDAGEFDWRTTGPAGGTNP